MAINQSAVVNLRLNLSEKAPIGILSARHEKSATAYDMHYPVELGFVTRGKMRRCYQDFEQDLGVGQIWLCGIWEIHGYKILEGPCESVALVALPETLARSRFLEYPHFNWLAPFSLSPRLRPYSLPTEGTGILNRLANAYAELSAPNPTARLKLRLYLLEILLLLSGNSPGAVDAGNVSATRYDRLRQAVRLVFNTPGYVTVKEAAATCGLSRNNFSRQFEKIMGISFAKFALRHRLGRVAEQLLRTNDSVKEIAANLDFTDKSHLQRRFTEHYGCTPAEYRKSLRREN